MSIFAYLDGVNVATANVRLNGAGNQGIGGLPSAADGTGSQGNIVFDDSTGTLDVKGWQIVKVDEPDTPGARTLFYGTVADRTERRGPYRQGAGRQIDTTINDHNVFLSMRPATGADAKRPEETDQERLDWLLASDYLDGLVYDLGFVTGSGLTFDAADLHGLYPTEILSDLASRYDQIFFTYWDQSAQKVGLFFDLPGSTTFTCTLFISNVESDITRDATHEVTGTVYPPFYDGELTRDPADVYSKVRFTYTGGVYYGSDDATAAEFFPEPLRYRGVNVENDRVGKRSTAITFTNRILAADSGERETVGFTVRLPSTKVGLIQAGMRIFLRFSHLTGFTTGAWTRIERINIVPTEGNPLFYDVAVQCSVGGLHSATGTGGGSTDPFPYVPPGSDPVIVQQVSGAGNIQFVNPIGAGNTLIARMTCRSASMVGSWVADGGYTLCPDGESNDPGGTNTAVIVYKLTDGTESQYIGGIVGATNIGIETNGTWTELLGEWTPDQHAERAAATTGVSTPAITAAANSYIAAVVGQGQGGAYDSVANTLSFTTGSGFTEDFDTYNPSGGHPSVLTAHLIGSGSVALTASNSGNVGLSGTDYNYIAQIVSFTQTGTPATPEPPGAGKPVEDETPTPDPDGVETVFTTEFSFATGSLHVTMNGSELDSGVDFTETTSTTFTFTDPPPTDAQIVVWYIAGA